MPKRTATKKQPAKTPAGDPLARDQIHVFGVRHLSPMAALQLRHLLDEVQPTAVLIEGLHDADELISDIVRKDTVPPIAILAYSDSIPVRTLVYPVARYSPEYQALLWSSENGVEARFIDLPSDIFLGIQDRAQRQFEESLSSVSDQEHSEDEFPDSSEPDHEDESSGEELTPTNAPESARDLSQYEKIAHEAGEDDYENFWERRFEHLEQKGAYRQAALRLGEHLREIDAQSNNLNELAIARKMDYAENLIREAFMRRCIDQTISEGHEPHRIVVIVGAYHASVLGSDHQAMTDEELEQLPRLASKHTLMPYSYFKLSSQSGYGAGNRAPAYFELLWDCIEGESDDHLDQGVGRLAALYLTEVVRELRKTGTHRSTAEVIDAVRLARVLTSMKQGLAPTLSDLRDAAVAVIGQGSLPALAEPMAKVEVGTAIGQLPKGVSQTSIQDDFNSLMKSLNLEKYRKTTKQQLGLDLRENRRAKTEAAAYVDLNRSTFLHRLKLLNIPFASPLGNTQESATWSEKWELKWTPESEIALVEAVLMGETVEAAAAFVLKQRIDEAKTIGEAAELIEVASHCEFLDGLLAAKTQLQALSANNSTLVDMAAANFHLMQTIRYGDVRRFEPGPLLPLMSELFVQACLALVGSAQCDQTTAQKIVTAMDRLNQVALQYDELVDEALWLERLKDLASRDDRNPKLSGYACALLLERGQMDNDELAREVSRRLSPGIAADLGAGWFEGLAGRNRYALLARQSLWRQLNSYIEELDDEQFNRSVVFLRRAFGEFSIQEKRAIGENLGECWGTSQSLASEIIEQPLTEEEEEKIDELNDFDFDDF